MQRKGSAVATVSAEGLRWFDKEEEYLTSMHQSCVDLAREYMKLYTATHKIQTRLRLPAIILSSLSGVASFGSGSFPGDSTRWVSMAVGVVNVGIAIIQTYESYLKIADIVSKSLSTSTSLKKLADDIHTEVFIPLVDRDSSGITFLRDCFSRYQVILEQAPPLDLAKFDRGIIGYAHSTTSMIGDEIRRRDAEIDEIHRDLRRRKTTSSTETPRGTRQTLPLQPSSSSPSPTATPFVENAGRGMTSDSSSEFIVNIPASRLQKMRDTL